MFGTITDSRWTTKLCYGKYTHMVEIACGDGLEDPLPWAKATLRNGFRTNSDYTPSRRKRSIRFYTLSQDHDTLSRRYADRVVARRRPFSDQAEAALLDGMVLQIRPRLFYNRFRYSVKLHCRPGRFEQLTDWVGNAFMGDRHTHRLTRSPYLPILYLRDPSDLLLVRMAQPARIIEIAMACTDTEVLKAIR